MAKEYHAFLMMVASVIVGYFVGNEVLNFPFTVLVGLLLGVWFGETMIKDSKTNPRR